MIFGKLNRLGDCCHYHKTPLDDNDPITYRPQNNNQTNVVGTGSIVWLLGPCMQQLVYIDSIQPIQTLGIIGYSAIRFCRKHSLAVGGGTTVFPLLFCNLFNFPYLSTRGYLLRQYQNLYFKRKTCRIKSI